MNSVVELWLPSPVEYQPQFAVMISYMILDDKYFKYMMNLWSIDEQDWVKLYRTLVRGDHRVRSPIYTWEAPLCT